MPHLSREAYDMEKCNFCCEIRSLEETALIMTFLVWAFLLSDKSTATTHDWGTLGKCDPITPKNISHIRAMHGCGMCGTAICASSSAPNLLRR